MTITLGNDDRELWWVTNMTHGTISIGDLPNIPPILSGHRINLLQFETRELIARSKTLSDLIRYGKLSLNKHKCFEGDCIVPSSNADTSIAPAEEDELPSAFDITGYDVTTDEAVLRTNLDDNTLEETGITICDNDCFHNVNSINFKTSPADEIHITGKIHWNTDDGTLEVDLLGGNVKLQVGQENVVYVRNLSGADIPNGKVVYINGAQGNSDRPTIALADNTNPDTIHVAGLTTEDIGDGDLGYITTQGKVRGVDTSNWEEGDKLYLSTNGNLSNIHPTSPTAAVILVGRAVNKKLDGTIEVILPQMFSIGNDFNGTLRTSILNKSSGNKAAAGFTAVNDNSHYTTIGIAGSGNTSFPGEVSIHYGPGYGDHWSAVDGAKDFVWFTDPEDRHNNGSLEYERMRLKGDSGDLYVSAGDLHLSNTNPDNPSVPGGNLYVANNVYLSNIPTIDPHVPGALWNSGGTVKISSG